MQNFEAIKSLVNMTEVGKDVKLFLAQLNELTGSSHESLDDLLNELKSQKLAELTGAVRPSRERGVPLSDPQEEARRLARNEASRRCKAKKAAEAKAAKEA